jgi:DNA polymerase V
MVAARIPFLGTVGAGFPKASEGYEDHPLDLQDLLVTCPAATFFFRLVGDALRDEGMPSGAVLVVNRSIVPSKGKLIVVQDESAFVVRRMMARETGIVYGVVTASIVRY